LVLNKRYIGLIKARQIVIESFAAPYRIKSNHVTYQLTLQAKKKKSIELEFLDLIQILPSVSREAELRSVMHPSDVNAHSTGGSIGARMSPSLSLSLTHSLANRIY
jgi:hypothetical protein